MGGVLQRIEVLLVGLVLLVAGAVVAGLLFVRPTAPTAYIQITPQPIMSSISTPTVATALVRTTEPIRQSTAAPGATVAITATSAPIATLASLVTAVPSAPATLATHTVIGWLPLPLILITAWPWLLLAVGVGGGTIVLFRIRKQRMTYTNQTVGQLLAAADDVTRESNIRVMRGLAEQGMLTTELAAAAGIDLTQPRKQRSRWLPRPHPPHLTIPHLTVPRVRLPVLRMVTMRLPKSSLRRRQWPHARASESAASMALATNGSDAGHDYERDNRSAIAQEVLATQIVTFMPASAPISDPRVAVREGAPDPAEREAAQHDVLAAQAIEPPAIELSALPDAHTDTTGAWTAEDRALAVAGVLATIWAIAELCSPILALDTETAPGNGQVVVTIDRHPSEEMLIVDLPAQIVAQRPTWRAFWQQNLLAVDVVTNVAAPVGGPLLVPLLAHGRGGNLTRFYPLAAWQHLGLYGAGALGALHTLLGSLLYSQPPSNVALAIIDTGEITPLYRDVAHLVSLPSTMHESIKILAQAVKHGARDAVRPLVLIVIEPNDRLLTLLIDIAARIRAKPNTPLHLLIVQEYLSIAGRELYAMLPALITSGGQGSIALLPGQGNWPKRTLARFVGRGIRVEGRAISMNEADIAAMVAHMRGKPVGLPQVLWEISTLPYEPPARTPATSEMDVQGDVEQPDAEVAQIEVIIKEQPEHLVPNQNNDHRSARKRLPGPTDLNQAVLDGNTNNTNDPTAPESSPGTDNQITMIEAGPVDAPISVAHITVEVIANNPDQAVVHPISSAFTNTGLLLEASTMQDSDSGDTVTPDNPASSVVQAAESPHSRRAALLRAASDSGREDAPPLQTLLPHRREPHASEQPISVGRAVDRPTEMQPIAEPDNGWPIGPVPLGRVAMAELMAHMASSPTIIAGQANEVGVTKNRIVDLLKGAYKAQAKELAEILLVWFDLAGLLIAPTKPGRLRHPRALTTTNLAEIAAKLNATPCPDKMTVKTLWALSNEGRD